MRSTWAALLLLALCVSSRADPLIDLPARWSDRVAPIPTQRLAELEPAAAERIGETRRRLGELLEASETDAAELAAVYGRLGALYAAHRLYAGAELSFGNAGALEPQGFQWAYYAAHLALEQGEAEKALEHLARAAELNAAYPTLPLRRGEALLGLNRLEEARQAYARAAQVPELRAAALYGLAQVDFLERRWEDAAAKFRAVLTLQPGADALYYPLGQALVRLGRREEARDHLAKRGVVKPDYADALVSDLRSFQTGARSRFEAGVAAVNRRDYAAAVTAFAAGLAEDPANARARTSYARALWISGQREKAASELRRAIADAPDETLPRFLLAVLQDAANDPDAAIAGYQAVLALDPDHEGALSYLANLKLRQGDYAEAAALFEDAIAAGVNQMPVYLHYWGALQRASAADAVLLEKLLEFDRRFSEPPVFRYLLAKLLATSTKTGVADTSRALAIASELHDMQPIPPHTELLALALAAAGDFVQAQELQEGLVETARMAGAWPQAARLEEVATSYRSERLPERLWLLQDSLFMPPPADPESPMRNYPAPQPH